MTMYKKMINVHSVSLSRRGATFALPGTFTTRQISFSPTRPIPHKFTTKMTGRGRRHYPIACNSVVRSLSTTTGSKIPVCIEGITKNSSRKFSTPMPEMAETGTFAPQLGRQREAFPSIVIGSGTITPQGSFAEAQSQYMNLDSQSIELLHEKLVASNMGVVAHYYMDVELQGTLQALQSDPYNYGAVHIADSLAMGDAAVKMCRDHGVTSIACLGVDFMAESVAAIMEKGGYGHVPVYRATAREIGCSLAESAERPQYRAWLEKAAASTNPLHVVYINTSLETKAVSSFTIPTITCTSSNVVNTMLQASSQIDDLNIFYGPDTYMGNNIVTMFNSIISSWDDDKIATLHPAHDRASLKRLRDSINVFPNGNCVVHHMFGDQVVQTVRDHYDDAYVTAHLEVPGEMFEIAMEKSLEGKGAVGSTSNILDFITEKVSEAVEQGSKGEGQRLRFILGTEAGMVTSIVRSVQNILVKHGRRDIEAEIIFPVAAEAVTPVEGDADIAVVPGVPAGEGCSTAGGCATCPFMKMNDLDALMDVADIVIDSEEGANTKTALMLRDYLPPQRLKGKYLGGVKATELGVEPIMHMRSFMLNNILSDDLVQKITQNSINQNPQVTRTNYDNLLKNKSKQVQPSVATNIRSLRDGTDIQQNSNVLS